MVLYYLPIEVVGFRDTPAPADVIIARFIYAILTHVRAHLGGYPPADDNFIADLIMTALIEKSPSKPCGERVSNVTKLLQCYKVLFIGQYFNNFTPEKPRKIGKNSDLIILI